MLHLELAAMKCCALVSMLALCITIGFTNSQMLMRDGGLRAPKGFELLWSVFHSCSQ